MKQEITLTLASVPETGSVEIGYQWNGTPGTAVFPDVDTLVASNASLLTTSDEAARWLLFYLLNTGIAPAGLASQVGRKLVIDVRPAVQQTIALVDA